MGNPKLVKTYNAGGVIGPNKIVKFSASGTVVLAAASTDALVGISRTNITTAASGDRVDVVESGIYEVVCGGTVARGDKITSDASGNGVTWSAGRSIGEALESGVAADLIPVKIVQN